MHAQTSIFPFLRRGAGINRTFPPFWLAFSSFRRRSCSVRYLQNPLHEDHHGRVFAASVEGERARSHADVRAFVDRETGRAGLEGPEPDLDELEMAQSRKSIRSMSRK